MKIEVGKIVGVWGVKGWIKLHSYTRNREDIAGYKTWFLSENGACLEPNDSVKFFVKECRAQGRGIVAYLESIDSRDQAEKLVGLKILIDREQLPKLPEGEYYWQDLIGLDVFDLSNARLGSVKRLLETGANDVLVLDSAVNDYAAETSEQKSQEILVPYTNEVVVKVDLVAGQMQVDWDPAFLSD